MPSGPRHFDYVHGKRTGNVSYVFPCQKDNICVIHKCAGLARRSSSRLQRRKEALCTSRTMCERRRERLRTAESIASMRWSLMQRPESSAGASRGDGELQASLSRSCAQNTTHAAEQPRGAGDAAPLPKPCVPLSPQLATSSASLQSPRLSFECVGSMLKKQRAPRRPQGQYLRH